MCGAGQGGLQILEVANLLVILFGPDTYHGVFFSRLCGFSLGIRA